MAVSPDVGKSPYDVQVRDRTYHEGVASASGYERLYMVLVDSDVGTWQLELKGDHPAAAFLKEPGAGIVVRAAGTDDVIMSGSRVSAELTVDSAFPNGKWVFTGETDEAILRDEVVYPSQVVDVSDTALMSFTPSHSRSTSVPAEDAICAVVLATVSATAPVARRRYPWFATPISQGRGAVVSRKDRWCTVLESVQKMATLGGLSFSVRQTGPGVVSLIVRVPAVRAGAKWSLESGNLTSASLVYRAPDIDEGIAGDFEGDTTRKFTRRTRAASQAAWGRRRVKFFNTSEDELAQMQATLDEDLDDGAERAGIKIHPKETAGLRFGEHYQLGDIGTASMAGVDLTDRIRQVVIDHHAGAAPQVDPSVGDPDVADSPAWVKTVRSMFRRYVAPSARR
ncbi:Gp37-like protein [Streptomyces sp.]|uniref:Gp37-like protein n=1 Tax=Streptomyces sp. TaxID=1931 RepID=UPI002F92E7CC